MIIKVNLISNNNICQTSRSNSILFDFQKVWGFCFNAYVIVKNNVFLYNVLASIAYQILKVRSRHVIQSEILNISINFRFHQIYKKQWSKYITITYVPWRWVLSFIQISSLDQILVYNNMTWNIKSFH